MMARALSPAAPPGPRLDLARPMRAGLLAALLLFGVFGTWAAMAKIGGAVVASGQTVVQGRPKEVQSLSGGVVAEILVANGDRVEAGQLLVRLDPASLQASLDISRARLAAALARQARLAAEQQGLAAPDYAYAALPVPLPDTAADEANEAAIFAARQAVRMGQRDRLAEAEADYDSQEAGLAAQIAALAAQAALLDADITQTAALAGRGLATQTQLNALERERAQLAGQQAALEAESARLAIARRDAGLVTLQDERVFLEEVATRAQETRSEIEELVLQILSLQADIARLDLRAPATGLVHEMQITTLGGVVAPDQRIMEVIPQEGLEVEVRVDPRSIADVRPGQKAQLMFASFDAQEVPRIGAEVATISADAIADPRTGTSYYRVTLAIAPEELARLGTHELVPGMPVDAFLETGERSVLSYLVEPASRHLARAFRE